MSVLSFDELNRLGKKRRSEPIDEYYSPMRISAKRRQNRIRTAEEYRDAVLEYLRFVDEYGEYEDYIVEAAGKFLYDKLLEVINDLALVDESLYLYVKTVSKQINESTFRNKEKQPYYLSEDRATYIGEDESNSIWNFEELLEAKQVGGKRKIWRTMRDNRVRETHRELEGKTLPLEATFDVGGYEMMVPRDPNVDAPEEKEGCRCWLQFI